MTHPTSIPAEDTLRKTDAFSLCVYPPADGLLRTEITLGSAPAVTLTLAAAQDELTKLRTWMEDIARGISPALVCFADGTALSCRREYDDETGFAKTERFLDEEYPTGISTFCVRDAQGAEYGALIKTKHFLNYLYISLLTGGNPDRDADYLPHFSEQWYAHTPIRQRCERYYDHYRIFSSRLLEWYLSCKEARPRHIPSFKPLPDTTDFVLMWEDFVDALFWHNGGCCGYSECLGLNDVSIDLSDIPELAVWSHDFDELTSKVMKNGIDEEAPYAAIGEEVRSEWHTRGLKLAEKIRPRIPRPFVLIYEQSWDLAYDTPYFDNDCGRIIFDERFIAEDT